MVLSGDVLTVLGHPAALEAAYQRLRPQSGRQVARVAAALLRSPEELLDDLAPLVEIGAVRVRGTVLEVATPVELLRGVVEGQAVVAGRTQALLEGVGRAIELLAAEQRLSVTGRAGDSQPVEGELWVGGDVLARVRATLLGTTGDLAWLRPDQWRGPREDRMIELVAEVVAQGRRSRAIYPVRALHDAPEVLAARLGAGEEIRVLPELPTRLLVIGDTHAVVPEPLGLADLPLAVVQQRGLVQAMGSWFEELWGRAAVPALDAAEPRLDLRQFLLEQLAAGAHDEQIARKLGISLRTVRRRVSALMTELGADSRFQAGVEAGRRGWL
ncbi:DNA-binding protein [Nocardioides sp. Root1257]|uniref:helix-turn-helix transcriptional regulator n=1 Tax=unclassified Nocardioides TaxID=2615069 RepID=UPI000700D32A|nr:MULTISPECIES: helix-turn-helix transcriptional regulator [unclassified Nocardioides]KQW47997.1 DNA-binding protein [Nocardioides sp. Root1257]KRC45249.1 DNA-binding protein [Nocardioides sp. Root224]